mmetsp:Transcript_25629/g.73143  ORF Transcript_25629/g.73143 Transcript_25629/m.73143 type:complete len:316 (-) Transcript_25629:149-1096(-)
MASHFYRLTGLGKDDKMASVEERLARLEAWSSHQAQLTCRKATSLLWMGSVSGFLGFVFAFFLGLVKYFEGTTVFASGNGPFPPTVSEMVHDPRSPAGKCFFAFELIGSICIFLSWYPFELRNVYIGDDLKTPFGLSWVTCRQFLPPIGMMLVACVPTTPAAQADLADQVTVLVHCMGAMMMFIGYIFLEGRALAWGVWKDSRTPLRIKPREWWVRCLLLTGVLHGFCCFIAFQALLIPDLGLCCFDEWAPKEGYERVQLVNTASGWILFFKIGSYFGEVVSGLCLIASHMAIWYYCEERRVDLVETIPVAEYRR